MLALRALSELGASALGALLSVVVACLAVSDKA